MNQDIERFLNLVNMPARATVDQAAALLGFSPHEIPILMSKGLLKPLGHPAPNGQKFFLTEALKELRRDEKWFGKATDTVSAYWRIKNEKKSNSSSNDRNIGKSTEAAELTDVRT